MISTDERLKILQMLQEGKITPDSAAQLLQAVEVSSEPPERRATEPWNDSLSSEGKPMGQPRWLRVRVTDTDTGRPRVNVRLPISLVNIGLKLGSRFTPEIEGMDLSEIIHAAQSGESGLFVDVYDEDDGEHVEVFLE